MSSKGKKSMTIRSLIASCSTAGVLVLSPLLAANPAHAESRETAQFCWAIGTYDHTVYFAETEDREDRQASFASLLEISGIDHRSLECRIQDLGSHRLTRAMLMKQWRESELEIVNTTFLSDLDY